MQTIADNGQTLIKALRFCKLKDLYRPAAPILKTLTRDPETFRTRDAMEGEETIRDMIQRGKSHFIDTERQVVAENQHEDLFYNEADGLEDMVLFPEEHSESKRFSNRIQTRSTSFLEARLIGTVS